MDLLSSDAGETSINRKNAVIKLLSPRKKCLAGKHTLEKSKEFIEKHSFRCYNNIGSYVFDTLCGKGGSGCPRIKLPF